MPRTQNRLRNIVFTLNNYTDADYSKFQKLCTNEDYRNKCYVTYIVFQQEVGEQGTRHFQGYLEFSKQVRLTWIHRNIHPRIHVEPRRGSQKQAIDYCKKSDTRLQNTVPLEGGVPKKQKETQSLTALCEDIQNNNLQCSEVIDTYPTLWLQHRNKIMDFALDTKGERKWNMDIHIYYGVPGTGKSFSAHQENPEAYIISWPKGGRWWWDGYMGEEVVIGDEFRNDISYAQMLKFFDRYPWKIEAKGRQFDFVSKKIILTTNIDPKDWYPGVEDKSALERRIREFATIWDFKEGCTFPDFEKVARTETFKFNTFVAPHDN